MTLLTSCLMDKTRHMTWEEWKELGDAAKEMRRAVLKVEELMRGRFNKTGKPYKSWWKAEKATEQLRSDLDDVVCNLHGRGNLMGRSQEYSTELMRNASGLDRFSQERPVV